MLGAGSIDLIDGPNFSSWYYYKTQVIPTKLNPMHLLASILEPDMGLWVEIRPNLGTKSLGGKMVILFQRWDDNTAKG